MRRRIAVSRLLIEVRQVGLSQPAVHRTIVIIDVENFGDPARTNTNQLAVREGMYEALRQSFAQAGISWDSCVAEDRGDGVMVLVSPEVPKSWLVSVVPIRLAAMLAEHNAACEVQERIRLRMALHAGEVHRDAHGWAGASLNRAFRLIDAPACREALRGSSGFLRTQGYWPQAQALHRIALNTARLVDDR